MRFLLPFRKPATYTSYRQVESRVIAGASYKIRRVSLGERIHLLTRARELSKQSEYLRAGDVSEELEASISDLLVRRMYVEWGLLAIDGLTIDGEFATPASVIEKGPEALTDEIIAELKTELSLTDEERKN